MRADFIKATKKLRFAPPSAITVPFLRLYFQRKLAKGMYFFRTETNSCILQTSRYTSKVFTELLGFGLPSTELRKLREKGAQGQGEFVREAVATALTHTMAVAVSSYKVGPIQCSYIVRVQCLSVYFLCAFARKRRIF